MMTAWTRWRISSAIDNDKPLSPGLARKVRHDPECRRFYEASLAMTRRLRQQAAEVIEIEQDNLADIGPLELPEPLRRQPQASTLYRHKSFAWATAVGVVVFVSGLGAWWFASVRSGPEPQRQSAAKPAEVAKLAAIIRQIKDNLDNVAAKSSPQWKQRVARSGEALRVPVKREAENFANDAREILGAFSSIITLRSPSQRSDSKDDPPAPHSSGADTPVGPGYACGRDRGGMST